MTAPDADLLRELNGLIDGWYDGNPPAVPIFDVLTSCRAAIAEQVPREPTVDMLEAAINNDLADISMELAAEVWRAMYDAAIAQALPKQIEDLNRVGEK